MSFAEPVLLAGLLLLPLAALAYGALQRRRRREAGAWGNPALLGALATERPGWRRHLPPALVLLALAACVLALARPQRTVAAPQRAANVILVQDTSGSMESNDVQPDRLSAAVKAAKTLTDKLPPAFRVGLVAFSDYAEQRVSPTVDHGQIKGALDQLTADGGTAMGDGLEAGLVAARTPVPNASGTGVHVLPSVVVLLSDGKNTSGTLDVLDVAREARKVHIPVYTIALGTPDGIVQLPDQYGQMVPVPVPPDPEQLREIAQLSGGKAFTATEAGKLQQIYSGLGTSLSSKTEKHEVTAGFAGAAIALLVLAGSLSLRWFGRLL
jgi:Ca-activated chloride channel family protein